MDAIVDSIRLFFLKPIVLELHPSLFHKQHTTAIQQPNDPNDPNGTQISADDNIYLVADISKTNPCYISFYKYSGNFGLYPIFFTGNSSVSFHSNVNIRNNLNIIDNVTIDNDCIVKKVKKYYHLDDSIIIN
mgnify:CR=1 FL=1